MRTLRLSLTFATSALLAAGCANSSDTAAQKDPASTASTVVSAPATLPATTTTQPVDPDEIDAILTEIAQLALPTGSTDPIGAIAATRDDARDFATRLRSTPPAGVPVDEIAPIASGVERYADGLEEMHDCYAQAFVDGDMSCTGPIRKRTGDAMFDLGAESAGLFRYGTLTMDDMRRLSEEALAATSR